MEQLQQLENVWPLLIMMAIQTVAISRVNATRLNMVERSLEAVHKRLDNFLLKRD